MCVWGGGGAQRGGGGVGMDELMEDKMLVKKTKRFNLSSMPP